MTDRELLERAANAAGLTIRYWNPTGWADVGPINDWWNPLVDDGDALRLAVKLRLDIRQWDSWVEVDPFSDGSGPQEDYASDPYAATRRAIVRAAAQMGE